MLRMIDLMAHGHLDHSSGTQYSVSDAAAAVGYRKKAARELVKSPVFMNALNKELHALRSNEAARSIKTLIEIRDEKGENRAADRKVRLQAAQVLLGEGDGKQGPSVTVNVQTLSPGYVIDLTPHDAVASQPVAPRTTIPVPSRLALPRN